MKRLLAVCFLGLLLALAHLASAQMTVHISFDDVKDGTLINTYYSNYGVTFDCHFGREIDGTKSEYNACLNTNSTGYGGDVYARTPTIPGGSSSTCSYGWIPTPSLAHSPPNGISIYPLVPCPGNQTYFNDQNGYVVARFQVPVSSVSIWANPSVPTNPPNVNTPNMPYLNAYDTRGNWLVTAHYSSSDINAPGLGWQQLNITPSMVNNIPIGMVQFSSSNDGSDFYVPAWFDDLTFTQSCAAPVSVPNVVRLPITTADNDIVAAGLVVGTFTWQHSTLPIGDVISTYPMGLTGVCPGTIVSGVVSSGSTPPPPPH